MQRSDILNKKSPMPRRMKSQKEGIPFVPLREVPSYAPFLEKDTLVVFGEVFQKGYVNGLIREAKRRNLQIIYSTVGRRESDFTLRPLNQEELKEKDSPLINIPLEAGFDLEPSSKMQKPIDFFKKWSLKEWDQKGLLDWDQIEESRKKGEERFIESVKRYVQDLEKRLQNLDSNLLIVHTMAGGFPRAKAIMPVANRVFKGFEDRYLSSQAFWESDMGKLCEMSFLEVTGKSFEHLIELTSNLRSKFESKGKKVRYLAYGYHGTEVLVNDKYGWQAYSPYLQGLAKLKLEQIARKAWEKGIKATVYNSPEILTASSHIFLGVEVSLYPLLGSLMRENKKNSDLSILKKCENLLKDEFKIDDILKKTDQYFLSEVIKNWSAFEDWPKHNGPEQMKMMRENSSDLIGMHKDKKNLITQELSELVFSMSGKIMLDHSWEPKEPVLWLGHDIISKRFLS